MKLTKFLSGSRTSVRLAGRPQAEKLAHYMREQGMTHGDTARVDIKHVRVGLPVGDGSLVQGGLYFCEMRGIDVLQALAAGDGGPIPEEATMNAIKVPSLGYYDLKNVLVTSNGRIQLTVDRRSEIVPAEVEA
jgi:hypothetical protein